MQNKSLIIDAYKDISRLLPELDIKTKPDDELNAEDFIELLNLVYERQKDFLADDGSLKNRTKIKKISQAIEKILINIANEEIRIFHLKKLEESIQSYKNDITNLEAEKEKLLNEFRSDEELQKLSQETGVDIELIIKFSYAITHLSLNLTIDKYPLSFSTTPLSLTEYTSILNGFRNYLDITSVERIESFLRGGGNTIHNILWKDVKSIINQKITSFDDKLSSYALIVQQLVQAKLLTLKSVTKINQKTKEGSVQEIEKDFRENFAKPRIGSHNSGISSGYHHWLPNQKLTITEQLNAGVRALELDLSSTKNSDIIISHDGYRSNWPYKTYYKDIIKEIGEWLKKNPNKTLIIQLDNGNLNGGKTQPDEILKSGIIEKLIQPIKEYIGEEKIYEYNALIKKTPDILTYIISEKNYMLFNNSLEEILNAAAEMPTLNQEKHGRVLLLSQISLPDQNLFTLVPWGGYGLKNSLKSSDIKEFIKSGGASNSFAEVGEGGYRNKISIKEIETIIALGAKIISLDSIKKNDPRINEFYKKSGSYLKEVDTENLNSSDNKELCPALNSEKELIFLGCNFKLPLVIHFQDNDFGYSKDFYMTWNEAKELKEFLTPPRDANISDILLPSWVNQNDLRYNGNGLKFTIEDQDQIEKIEDLDSNTNTYGTAAIFLALIGVALIYNLQNRRRFKEKDAESSPSTSNPKSDVTNATITIKKDNFKVV